MAYLAEILTEAGLENVKTYIQSGNIFFETTLSDDDVYALIHDTIQAKIGADLSVILKTQAQFTTALAKSPFDESYDVSRVHLVFTNDQFSQDKLADLLETDFGDEILRAGSECLYLYLPREAKKKRLKTNYLEKQLYITATIQKLRSVSRLSQM
ncbi:hypothetical protein Si129_00522 [Streptococcus infantarius subsp. infantarius]|uniref:DUF1697 domain-containing protein n=1 Tax=Streptococcus infantarius TaxID=102684 RepID=UPI00208FAA30|nr:DUF1697 domain-containing protein [Streptococcus infantarius]MCO4479843.1 hypothetical protein [Streptococcus infantarius subsp. infantarius]MCO4482226.1 hypothetical protein [Streptococcus infantarius subsp. infantarius]MCO4496895.1 hypothetical protein [Streptococcus infantarius subsp. infantarius]MCO4497816.1 hypothetical protein [Streptococcus infantarius subsp. infantarius]MCO4499823.1 hypothetical protein [Streptococcus infantarius subsp. infantarius]